jgi:hypothetical protein
MEKIRPNPGEATVKLIPQWRSAWKMSSVQLAILGAVLNAAAVAWSVFQGAVDPLIFAGVNMVLSIAVAVSRVVLQPSIRTEETPDGRS